MADQTIPSIKNLRGNIGIGTASPAAKLHIDVTTEDNQPALRISKVSDQNENALEVYHGTNSAQRGIADFTNADGSVLYVRGDGNVGINKTSPAQKLHIKGDALRIEESASTTGRHLDIVPAVSGQHHKYTSTSTGSGHQFENSSGTIAILDANGSAFYQDLTIASSDLKLSSAHYVQFGDATARIQGSNASNYLKFYTGGAERLAITNTEATFSGDLVVTGGLTINGTTTTINSTTLQVDDKNIELGTVATPSDTTADGGGITLKGASDYTINWTNSTNSWHFNQGITVGVDGTGHDVVFYGDTADRYMTWDQSVEKLKLRDNVMLTLGTHGDLQLSHDGVHGHVLYGGPNNFQISGNSVILIGYNDGSTYGETAIQCIKDGAVKIRHDNSQKFTTTAGGVDITGALGVSTNLNVSGYGTLAGLDINGNSQFDGAVTVGVDDTGHDVKFFGATTGFYLHWDESANALTGVYDLKLTDNREIQLGQSNDLRLYHSHPNNYIKANSGDLVIQSDSDDLKLLAEDDIVLRDNDDSTNFIHCINGGAVKLYHNGSQKFETSSTGATLNGNLVMGGGQVKFADGGHVMLGDSNDLRLYHSGSSYIDNITNDLIIRNTAASKDIIFYTNNGTSTIESLRIDGSGQDLNSRLNLHGGDASLYPYITGFVAPQNPEGHHIKCPYFFNDLAYARLRGATVTVTVTGGSSPNTTNIDRMLDASTYFWSVSTSGVSEIVITMEDLPKNFTHTTHMGITFGNEGWRAKNVKLEAYYNSQWNTLKDVTDQTEEYVHIRHNTGGNAQTKLRWTLSNFQTTSMRIASIYCYNYNANGMSDLYVTRDGGNVYGNIAFQDSKYATFGGGVDLSIGHDGSNSYISENGTGDLYLESNNATIYLRDSNGGNVMLAAKGGSGEKVELYYGGGKKLETTTNGISLHGDGYVDLPDNGRLRLGTNNDMMFYHNGTSLSILDFQNHDGLIRNLTNDKLFIFQTTSGGSQYEILRLGGSGVDARFSQHVSIGSSGTPKDLTTYGSTSARYMKWDGSADLLNFMDNVKITVGNSNDLQLYHDGSHSYVADTGTGGLKILGSQIEINNAANSENIATFTENGAVSLYHNNSKKLETNSAGVTVTGKLSATEVAVTNIATNKLVKFNGMLLDDSIISDDASTVTVGGALTVGVDDAGHDVIFYGATASRYLKWNQAEDRLNLRDNTKFSIGNSNDLQLEFNGTHGYIKNNVGGSLYIQTANTIQLENSSGQDMLTAASGGAVKLFHGGNSTAKLETTSTGIDVTGQISSDAFGPWYSTSTYVYDSTDGTRYFWNLLGTLPAAGGKGSIEYECKNDENYPHFVKGTIAFGSFTGGSYVSTSIQHDQQTADYFNVQVRIDTSRRIWIRIPNAAWSHFFRFRVHDNAGTFTTNTSWSTGTTRYDTATTSVPPNSSSDILSGRNLRVVDNDVTGSVPTYDTSHNFGRILARNRITSGDGTAGSTAYGFNNGTNTGMYLNDYTSSPQKDQLNFSVDGSRRLRINEAGTFVDGNSYVANGYQFRTFQEWLATTGGTGYGFKFRNTADAIDSMTISYAGNAVTAGSITSTSGHFCGSTLNLHTAGNINYISSQDASKDLVIRNTGSGKDMVLQVTSSSGTAEVLRLRGIVAKEIVASGNFEIRNGTNSRHINLYETYTDSSNYERSFFKHASSFLEIGTEAAGSGTASGLKLKTAGEDRVTVLSGGNVGIGTTSPSHKLHVRAESDGDWVARIGNTESTAGSNYGLKVGGGSNASDIGFEVANYAGDVNLRVRGDGNVGIGTSSPSARLQVENSAGGNLLTLARNSTSKLDFEFGTSNVSLVCGGEIQFRANGGTTNKFIINNSQIQSNAKLLVATSSGIEARAAGTSGGGLIRLTSTGETSAGNTVGKIEFYNSDTTDHTAGVMASIKAIAGPSGGEGHLQFLTDMPSEGAEANQVALHLHSNANVGIGTTSPDTKLEVAGVIKSSSTSRVQADVYNNSANSANIIYRSSSKTIVGNNADALVILDGGNVGINTTSPQQELDVEGLIKQKVYTISSLPTAGSSTTGARAFVSDSAVQYNSSNIGQQATYGGGSYFVPVYSDGSYWYIG